MVLIILWGKIKITTNYKISYFGVYFDWKSTYKHLTGRNSVYESFGTYHHGAGHIQSKIALDPLRGRYLRYRYEFFEGFPVKKLNSYYCEMEHATSPNFYKDKIIKLVFQN